MKDFRFCRHPELVSGSSHQVSASSKQGFTLIELLVVVLIIGILSAVALPQYRLSVAKARYTEAILWGNSIYKAQQVYYLANGERTANPEDLDISFPGATTSGSYVRFPHFECLINAGTGWAETWNHASVSCTTRDAVSYRRFYADSTPPLCLASKTNAFANQVCKTLSDREPFSWDGGTNYYYIR